MTQRLTSSSQTSLIHSCCSVPTGHRAGAVNCLDTQIVKPLGNYIFEFYESLQGRKITIKVHPQSGMFYFE